MELLILKTGSDYLRLLKDGSCEMVGMNKASVYPISKSDFVIEEFERLKKDYPKLEIKQLTITEQDYNIA